MPIGITDDHEALRRSVRRFLDEQSPPSVARARLDSDVDDLPAFWNQVAAMGLCGLHVSEAGGGGGATLVEAAVVLEEFGRSGAPGPLLPTIVAAALVERAGGAAGAQYLEPLSAGDQIGTFACAAGLVGRREGGNGAERVVIEGALTPVPGAAVADVLIAPVAIEGDAQPRWCAIELHADAVEIVAHANVDLVRRSGEVRATGASALVLTALDDAMARHVIAALVAAEAVGVAQWCVDTAATYARDRVQFGRPIGQFQGVKHKCADMLARTELARAAAWDAARAVDDGDNGGAVAVAAAAALAGDAAFECAKDCVQVLGGIGFTWEHDAHIYLRHAMALRALLGTASTWRVEAARHALAGARRRLAVDLGPEAEVLRSEVRAFLDSLAGLDAPPQRARMVDEGYITPAWPRPWGRGAGALELLVIEEEFRAAKVARPSIMVGAWALPNLIVHGTPEQQQRWIAPTLRGEITWCQLFSEPGAGSDLAALTTRAERVDGGWIVNGQKVWSTMAHTADWGILLARTDPDAAKHDGISCFMLDMRTSGVDPRPLRELTGQAMFNEVFFDDVFIPDDCLVGKEHDGWRAARTTLANERVFMGGSSTIGGGVAGVLKLLDASGLATDPHALETGGSLVVTAHALAVLGYRLTLFALGGADPSGSEAAVRKLLGVQHDQRTQEAGMELCGPAAVFADGDAGPWVASFLFNRCLTIAGGTTEIQKNVIAERLLGLPRDP